MTSEDVPRPVEWPKKHASWRITCDSWEDAEKMFEGFEYYLCREIGTKKRTVHFHALTLEHFDDILDRIKAYMAIHIKPGKDGKRAAGYDRTTNGTFHTALSYFLKDKEFRTTFAFPYHDHAKPWIKRVKRDAFYTLTEQNLLPLIWKFKKEHNLKYQFIDEYVQWIYENTDYRANKSLRETGVPRHLTDQFRCNSKRGWARDSVNDLFRVGRAYTTFARDDAPGPVHGPIEALSVDKLRPI